MGKILPTWKLHCWRRVPLHLHPFQKQSVESHPSGSTLSYAFLCNHMAPRFCSYQEVWKSATCKSCCSKQHCMRLNTMCRVACFPKRREASQKFLFRFYFLEEWGRKTGSKEKLPEEGNGVKEQGNEKTGGYGLLLLLLLTIQSEKIPSFSQNYCLGGLLVVVMIVTKRANIICYASLCNHEV